MGGNITLRNAATIHGTITSQPLADAICTCGHDLAADMAQSSAWNDNNRLYDEPSVAQYLHDGALEIDRVGRVTLASGDYFLTGLSLRNASVLAAYPGAHVRLFVSGPVSMDNASDFNFPPAADTRVDIICDYAGTLYLRNASESGVIVYAPSAEVRLDNASEMHGGVTARSLWLRNAGHLIRDVEAGDIGTIPATCQWE